MGPDTACNEPNMRNFKAVKYDDLGDNSKGVLYATH
jgi:hypothetical protein